MVAKDIVDRMKNGGVEQIDPDTAAEVYAHMLALLQDVLPAADIERFILIGTVMYQNSIRSQQLQIPGGVKAVSSVDPLGPLM